MNLLCKMSPSPIHLLLRAWEQFGSKNGNFMKWILVKLGSWIQIPDFPTLFLSLFCFLRSLKTIAFAILDLNYPPQCDISTIITTSSPYWPSSKWYQMCVTQKRLTGLHQVINGSRNFYLKWRFASIRGHIENEANLDQIQRKMGLCFDFFYSS